MSRTSLLIALVLVPAAALAQPEYDPGLPRPIPPLPPIPPLVDDSVLESFRAEEAPTPPLTEQEHARVREQLDERARSEDGFQRR